MAIPLLGPGLDVSFLFYADQTEAIADRNDIVTMPQFDTRRYYYYYGDNTGIAPGIRTANAKATLLGDNRRRSALEEHGFSPQKPPFYFAFDREVNRRRGLTLGRRDDGGTRELVVDRVLALTGGVGDHRLYRQHTSEHKGKTVKDIAKIGRDLRKVIILDNTPENFALQQQNGIYVKSWTGDPHDNSLTFLLPFFINIAKSEYEDVREVLLALKTMFQAQSLSPR